MFSVALPVRSLRYYWVRLSNGFSFEVCSVTASYVHGSTEDAKICLKLDLGPVFSLRCKVEDSAT